MIPTGGHHKLQSAEDLPSLSRLVRLALNAGVGRRKQGKLVGGRVAGLDEATAYEKVVRAAVTQGSAGRATFFPATRAGRRGRVRDRVACRPARRRFRRHPGPGARRLDGGVRRRDFLELPDLVAGLISGWVRTELQRLEDLGVITTQTTRRH